MDFEPAEPSEQTERWFVPKMNLRFRVICCSVLLALLAISPGGLFAKSIGQLLITFMTGSFRRSFIDAEIAHVQMTVCFIPLKINRYRLKRFYQIEIMLEEPAGWWTFFLFGPIQWLWFRMLDFAIPWLGGMYQIWIARGDKKVMLWQGGFDEDYEQNLEMLKSITGYEVIRSGGY
jgi:hypothetical protein